MTAKRKQRPQAPSDDPWALPMMMAELTVASWETIFYRSLMIAQGNFSNIEFKRMVAEKMRAARHSALAMMVPRVDGHLTAFMAPWHRRATANAKRLRSK